MDDKENELVCKLSGGMKRRLSVAIAFIGGKCFLKISILEYSWIYAFRFRSTDLFNVNLFYLFVRIEKSEKLIKAKKNVKHNTERILKMLEGM